MDSRTPLRILVVAFGALAAMPLAHAETGHVAPAGLLSGFVHPFHGVDHVLLLLCIGAWAAQLGRRARWTVPAMFVSIMACGAALGLRGAEPAMLQTMGLMALLAFALLVLGPVRWSFALIAAPLGIIVFFHGVAHAAQLGASSDGMGFTAGLLAGSAFLYAAGFTTSAVIGGWIHRHHDHWSGHAGGRMAH